MAFVYFQEDPTSVHMTPGSQLQTARTHWELAGPICGIVSAMNMINAKNKPGNGQESLELL